jgi:hypothetical protein
VLPDDFSAGKSVSVAGERLGTGFRAVRKESTAVRWKFNSKHS